MRDERAAELIYRWTESSFLLLSGHVKVVCLCVYLLLFFLSVAHDTSTFISSPYHLCLAIAATSPWCRILSGLHGDFFVRQLRLAVDGSRPIASTVPQLEPAHPFTRVSGRYKYFEGLLLSARGNMQGQTSTATMAYSTIPLPASPTLTNPDMILPYGEYDSTPSPPRGVYRSGSPSEDWDTNPATMQFAIGSSHSHMGLMTPTTPIIYGNGTMLSDIGEVTEAESTPGRKLPGPAERRLLKQQQNQTLRSSPTIGYDPVMRRTKTGTHQRKISIESTSTITSEAQQAELFKDFDDAASVDDSVFQGDDEESVVDSVADSYTEGVIASETKRLNQMDSGIDKTEDKNSSAALSRRAEQILLNAKKRLNVRICYMFPKMSTNTNHRVRIWRAILLEREARCIQLQRGLCPLYLAAVLCRDRPHLLRTNPEAFQPSGSLHQNIDSSVHLLSLP